MTLALEQQEGLVTIKSVTDGDVPKSVYYVAFGFGGFGLGMGQFQMFPKLLPAQLPMRYSQSVDCVLYEIGKFEGRWASAVAIAGSKIAARAFELKSDKTQLLKRYSELLHNFEGKHQSPVYFFRKVARDYLGCDNGVFIEIERESNAAGSRIKALHVLDSRRCRRTGVPEIPVIYTDLLGNQRLMRDYEVIDIVDQPDTWANAFGTGECAARRAYKSVRYMNLIDEYIYEKASGARPLALDFITGITDEQIQEILVTNEASRLSKGVSVYGGTVVVPMIKNADISHTRIPLAELPDKFDHEQSRRLALQDYANAIGIDSQELLPLTGQALGTGAQSQVLDDKQEGKGLATLLIEITHAMQQWVLPETVTFFFSEKTDYRDQKARADVFTTYATALSGLVDKGVIQPEQALQKLVDEELLPQEMLPNDLTPSVSISDTDKVGAEEALQDAAQEQNLLPAPTQVQGQTTNDTTNAQ